ncbi:MAG: SMP-30/gluconolactonase/LRE family protein [Candidatus Binatia bacterium]|nr:SMP-30/gluconolactonase/LRE family protein [Candidatus Binatia bacterium]
MNRYQMLLGAAAKEPQAAPGWRISRLLPASGLFGANGMQFGPDGRLYVTQAFGSQITAIDIRNGSLELISPLGGPIVAPDDVAFDSHGTMYVTEVMSARVCARTPAGTVRIVADNLPGANGITIHQDRVFIDEFRRGGRIFELYPYDGRAPRLIADDLRGPNALAVGPDGKLYFPLVPAGEVWRVDIETGTREKVAEGLKSPPAVKFNRRGELIVPQAGTGEVVRIDVQSGAKTVIARVRPGIDNLAFSPDNRLFLSHFVDGGVDEVATDGSNAERVLVPGGLVGPWAVACGEAGQLYIADGLSLAILSPRGHLTRLGGLLDNTFPGFVRGMAVGAPGELWLTTLTGDVVQYFPDGRPFRTIVRKLQQPYGLAWDSDGSIVCAEAATGKLLRVYLDGRSETIATGLAAPCDVVIAADRTVFVTEPAHGRVVRVARDGTVSVVCEGLAKPKGIALRQDTLLILDHGTKELRTFNLLTQQQQVLASHLPIGDPPGCSRGPMEFAGGLAVGPDGTIYIPADGEGSVLTLQGG